MRLVRLAAAGVAACALVGVVYGMGAASAGTTSAGTTGTGTTGTGTTGATASQVGPAVLAAPTPGATAGGADQSRWVQRFCANRLPKVEDRLSTAITRLTGDDTTKGSIARLQQRVAKAKAAGRDAEGDLLSILLDHRTQRLPMLRSTQQALTGWQHTYCTTS